MGENRGIIGSGKYCIVKEVICVYDKCICRVKYVGVFLDIGDLNGDDGEFFFYFVFFNCY